VHACWADENISVIKIDLPVEKEVLLKAHDKRSEIWRAFDETLKGKEMKLPDGHYFIDKDGHARTESRTKWWKSSSDINLSEFLFHVTVEVNKYSVPNELQNEGYNPNFPPVFFGDYWLDPQKEKPSLQASNVCCLDYSVAKRGCLVAYRHDIGENLCDSKFVITPSGTKG
jgi:hypothetical protein